MSERGHTEIIGGNGTKEKDGEYGGYGSKRRKKREKKGTKGISFFGDANAAFFPPNYPDFLWLNPKVPSEIQPEK